MSGLSGVLVLVFSVGGFLGALATIYRYVVRPIARTVATALELLEAWRTVPADIREMKDLLTTHVAGLELRLTALELPPLPYRQRKTS